MTIGDRIKQRRKELNLSVDELALKLKKNRATVYRYEKGDIENLPLDILEPIAKALEVSPAYLMGWEESEDFDDITDVTTTNEDEADLLESYRELSDKGKEAVRKMIDALLFSEGK